MTRLDISVDQATAVVSQGNLAKDADVRELLELTHARRSMDLSDVSPTAQAQLVERRCQQLQPSAASLAERFSKAAAEGRPFVAKFGIDPTGAEVHLGHAVPILLLSRFQRMGHKVVFIVGDVTAKIGDPSGRSDERPPLTDEQIAVNLSTYREQVSPLFDFSRAEFRHNGDWLRDVTLPRLIEITARVPVSMSLQREDFRNRLAAGHSLSLAELLYSVAMALDSVEVECDLEVGGIDQFLNMQMCRKVMEICGQEPELVAAVALLEGTDGTGAKMSKSRGNYVPLTAQAADVFGKLMSVPDHLVVPYLRALTEWQEPEIDAAQSRLRDGALHPMDFKKVMAGDVTAALHGVDAALKAREDFAAQFSARRLSDVDALPQVALDATPVVEVIKGLGWAGSNSEVRRAAEQKSLRLIMEDASGDQRQSVLSPDDLRRPLAEVVAEHDPVSALEPYFKMGRRAARIVRS
jgi:tyrosyl-tRNA synthetase